MRRLVLLAVILCLAPLARGQVGPVTGFCYQGGVSAVTQGLGSVNKLQGIIPSCTVTVYLTTTQTLATIYADGSSTPLANPFTAAALNSVAPGQWLFYAAKTAQYDVVLSGGIPPNTYAQPVTLIGQSAGATGGGGSSLLLSHNDVPLADQAYLNFLDITPGGPPLGNTNITIETDGAGDWSAYVPNTTAPVTQLLPGTCISLSPTDGLGNVTITNSCSGSISPVQIVLSTASLNANTCSTPLTKTMTGVVAPSGTTPGTIFAATPETNPAAVSGWGTAGGLVLQLWASAANTLSYAICNQSGNTVNPGALTVDVGPASGGSGGGGSGLTSFSAPSGSWPSWLVPTVTNPTTTPSLTVAAGAIPNSALANVSVTLGSTSVSLGGTISSATGFQSATTLAFAGTPTQCAAGNAPTGILPNGNATGCQAVPEGGGGGPVITLQQNGVNLLSQTLLNPVNTSTVTFTNPSGGVLSATVPTSAAGVLGVASPDNTSILAATGVLSIKSPGSGTILGFSSGNLYAGYTAGANISFAGNQISNTSPANAVMTGLSNGIIPEATGANTLGPSSITVVAGSTIIGSLTNANTDGWGHLAVSGTSVPYTFANTYLVAPECIAQPQGTSPSSGFSWLVNTTTTGFTIYFSSSFSGNVSYHCDKHT